MNANMWSAEKVRKAMKFARISQRELEGRAEVSTGHVSEILKGKHDIKVGTLFKLLAACGLEVVELRVREIQ
jgi:transcriptional regulator with XRE-family HTH domain